MTDLAPDDDDALAEDMERLRNLVMARLATGEFAPLTEDEIMLFCLGDPYVRTYH